MRAFPLTIPTLVLAVIPRALTAQSNTSTNIELQGTLTGSWVGTLEYRDFSEPATSTKRVKLPTWLEITPAGTDLKFAYVYDDGPAKTVAETSLIRIDSGAARYSVLDRTGKLEDSYVINGLSELRQGRGTLTLTGTGTDNNDPVDVRTTIRIGRNILEILRETAGSGKPFTFRHAYVFVRATSR